MLNGTEHLKNDEFGWLYEVENLMKMKLAYLSEILMQMHLLSIIHGQQSP